MKNIIEILSEQGITIPEDKHAALNKAVSENYKTIAEHEKKVSRLTADLEAERTARQTAEDTLKGFEGKDFDAIARERDEWKRKHEEQKAAHQKEQEDREFNEVLATAITDARGKNSKAIMALLDLETLRKSRNQDKDVRAALDALRTESGYLFDDNGGKPAFTQPGGNAGTGGSKTVKEIMAIKDPVERQAQIVQNMHLFKKG